MVHSGRVKIDKVLHIAAVFIVNSRNKDGTVANCTLLRPEDKVNLSQGETDFTIVYAQATAVDPATIALEAAKAKRKDG